MTKDEAYEILDESIGGGLCYQCPYFIVGTDDGFEWKDCTVDTPFHCPYVQLETESG